MHTDLWHQLILFLIAHHHTRWAHLVTTGTPRQLAHIWAWALRHGFVYQS